MQLHVQVHQVESK